MSNRQFLKACPHSNERGISPASALQVVALLLVLCSGCSIKTLAVNAVGDAIAESGTVYAGDEDIELVGDATPFGLKLMESLLAEAPEHRSLLLAAARGFTQYTFAYVQLPADELEELDVAAAYAQRDRARRLYLRARDYGLRGLETAYPGFAHGIRSDPAAQAARAGAGDGPLLYWTAAAWGAAIGLGKDNAALLADVPVVEALARRVLDLDETVEAGAVHGMMMSLVMAKPGTEAERIAQATKHFHRAVELSRGRSAAPYVTFAETVALARADKQVFETTLAQALLVDKEAAPRLRLANEVYQRRAAWLLARADHYFID